MIKAALKSIFDDFSGSLFYLLTFVLTSMFMFLFFHLSYSEAAGVTFINSKNNMTTFMSVIVIAMCMIVIFFANDFYVKKKSKELSVQLICGATFLQMTMFLLFQTFILFITAIPIGIMGGSISIPIVNLILTDLLNSEIYITFNKI